MTDVASIRNLFLDGNDVYSLPAAALLLRIEEREIAAWVEAGELEAVETASGLVLPWSEVASFAMELWSQEVVEGALGAEVTAVLPELLRLTELEVRIPRMEVVALEHLAAREGRSVDTVLARELLDLVSEHAECLSATVPEFAAALAWPLPPE